MLRRQRCQETRGNNPQLRLSIKARHRQRLLTRPRERRPAPRRYQRQLKGDHIKRTLQAVSYQHRHVYVQPQRVRSHDRAKRSAELSHRITLYTTRRLPVPRPQEPRRMQPVRSKVLRRHQEDVRPHHVQSLRRISKRRTSKKVQASQGSPCHYRRTISKARAQRRKVTRSTVQHEPSEPQEAFHKDQ